jgi:hypothetical protein
MDRASALLSGDEEENDDDDDDAQCQGVGSKLVLVRPSVCCCDLSLEREREPLQRRRATPAAIEAAASGIRREKFAFRARSGLGLSSKAPNTSTINPSIMVKKGKGAFDLRSIDSPTANAPPPRAFSH